MNRPARFREIALDSITALVLFALLSPILWVFVASVRPDPDIMAGGINSTPFHYCAL